MDIELKCVQEGSKLRVRIVSPGYNPNANCSFPRALREVDRRFLVPIENITFSENSSKKFFYRVKPKGIKVVETSTTPLKIYGNSEDDPTDCCVCLCEERSVAFAPCGHYITCLGCSGLLKVCPLCRTKISRIVKKEEII